ncbi:hypothetical protein F5887DRAFT_1068466 [Amanita rubescens]|nr:hypothetical protein F5887DRAFT_1068466 [Amanita rubescens]
MACIAGPEGPMVSMAASQLTTNSAPEFRYSGFTDLVEQIQNNTLGDIIVIKDVSLANFTEISSEREKRGLGFRLSLYTTDAGQLIVTIPTHLYEALHLLLNHSIQRSMPVVMGWELLPVGATTFTNLDDAGGVRSRGEGDSCLQPRVRPPDGFPTVVIEAGYTQSWNSLQEKARWWFEASHFDVKIVIFAKFESHDHGRITIEKWKAVEAVLWPGVRTWAQANAPAQAAACVQTIHITRPGNNPANPASYDVTAPLCLEFVDVFLRQPIEGQHEGNIVVGIAELQAYAVAFWRNVNE